MSEETGGPAFPLPVNSSYHDIGMSLRDYFAGQALINYSAKEIRHLLHSDAQEKDINLTPSDIDGLIVEACYLMADAMIKEKNK